MLILVVEILGQSKRLKITRMQTLMFIFLQNQNIKVNIEKITYSIYYFPWGFLPSSWVILINIIFVLAIGVIIGASNWFRSRKEENEIHLPKRFDRSMMEMFSWVHKINCRYSKKILTIWRRLRVIHKFTIFSLSLTSIFHNKECFLFVLAISYTATLATHYFFNYP